MALAASDTADPTSASTPVGLWVIACLRGCSTEMPTVTDRQLRQLLLPVIIPGTVPLPTYAHSHCLVVIQEL